MKFVALDIETKDPGLAAGEGPAWVHGTVEFIVGATHSPADGTIIHRSARSMIDYLEGGATHLIGHNISYDIGVLNQFGLDLEAYTLIDTLILGKLNDNRKMSYKLNDLAQEFLGASKSDAPLGDVAKELGLVKSKAQNPVKVAMTHLKEIYEYAPTLVEEYVVQDTELSYRVYRHLQDSVPGYNTDFYSDLIKAVMVSRKRGVRVDIYRAKEVKRLILQEETPLKDWLLVQHPNLNCNSSKQLAELLDSMGEEYPKTDKGNPSITKEWMSASHIHVLNIIAQIKKLEKLRRDFIEPLIDKFPDQQFGHLYPEIVIFGATATGRASCRNPNVQQIPKRDPIYGKLIRSIYCAHEGETLYSLDFSAQEPRFQVHFAARAGCKGAMTLVEEYRKNEKLDLHQMVADLAGIDRDSAKIINLGISYGMGIKKLSHSLKVTITQAQQLRR